MPSRVDTFPSDDVLSVSVSDCDGLGGRLPDCSSPPDTFLLGKSNEVRMEFQAEIARVTKIAPASARRLVYSECVTSISSIPEIELKSPSRPHSSNQTIIQEHRSLLHSV